MNYKVQNFDYNGFMVLNLPGETDYTAKFIEWTNDPGIAKCECSDGNIRFIPSCQLIGCKKELPKQEYEKAPDIFGQLSKS